MTLTADQIAAVKQGEPIRVTPQEIGEEVILLNAKVYQQLCAWREEAEDLRLQHAWTKATQQGLNLLLQEEE